MRPAATYTGGFRFERGILARALFYDPGNTSDRWDDVNYFTLVGGVSLASQSAALAAAVATILLLS